MKKLWLVLAVIFVSLFALTGCGNGGNDGSGDKTSLKIGLNFELTGDYQEYGNAEYEGVMLAIKLAQEAGDYPFEIDVVKLDNKSTLEETTSVVTKLMTQEKVGAVLGPAVSGLTIASYAIAEQYQVPLISPSATNDVATLKDDGSVYEYAFRTCFIDSYQGTAMAVFAKENLTATKAIIISDAGSDYAKGLAMSFKDRFIADGGVIVAEESYQERDTDFSTILTKIQGMDFDVIYIAGYYNEVGLIIRQARDLGIDVPITGGDGFDSPTLIDLAGADALNDVYFTTAYTTIDQSETVKAFVEAYNAEYGKDPSMFVALGFDTANLLLQAAKEAGATDAASIQQALINMESFTGVTGTFSFDENHNPSKTVFIVLLIDGVQAEATEVRP